MDLTERIADVINNIQGLPYPCMINFLTDNVGLSLYETVGSSTLYADWSGNLTKKINYEIAMRGTDPQQCINTLWKIEHKLSSLKELSSEDNSFIFQSLTVNSEPALTDADTAGHFQYNLGFSVIINQIGGR